MGELVTTRCWCSIEHSVPKSLYDLAMRDKKHAIYCPLGHQWVCAGESEADKERRLRQRFEQDNARLAEALSAERRLRESVETALKKQKARASAGVCPCCNRTVSQMARHMKSKHPDYNVVPLKAAKA